MRPIVRAIESSFRFTPNGNSNSLTSVTETVDAIRDAPSMPERISLNFKSASPAGPLSKPTRWQTTDVDSHKAEIVALIVVFIGMAIMLRSIWLALVGGNRPRRRHRLDLRLGHRRHRRSSISSRWSFSSP